MLETDTFNMWKEVSFPEKVPQHRGTPRLYIDAQRGRLTFNVNACALINELLFYDNLFVWEKVDDSGTKSVGFRFLNRQTDTSFVQNKFKVKKIFSAKDKNRIISCNIYSKILAAYLVRQIGNDSQCTKIKVEKSDATMLTIKCRSKADAE